MSFISSAPWQWSYCLQPSWTVQTGWQRRTLAPFPEARALWNSLRKNRGKCSRECQWCPGFQPLGSFWMHAKGNVSNSVLYSVMAVLISEWKASAAFLKHWQVAKIQHYTTQGDWLDWVGMWIWSRTNVCCNTDQGVIYEELSHDIYVNKL